MSQETYKNNLFCSSKISLFLICRFQYFRYYIAATKETFFLYQKRIQLFLHFILYYNLYKDSNIIKWRIWICIYIAGT